MTRYNTILVFLIILTAASGCLSPADTPASTTTIDNDSTPQEIEATTYDGVKLTPIAKQNNNGIKGAQYIDRDTYTLKIDGLVQNPASLTYDQIIAYPSVSKVVKLNCVEGWSFTAKWTGVPVKTLFDEAGIIQDTNGGTNATTIIFYSADGYSTAHELNYLLDNDIMLAYKLNDITLPPERGFPFQLVAEGKYGYKWGKWITSIEVTDEPYEGYWESRGFSNNADVGGPRFER